MSEQPARERTITVKALARVEGEGALHVRVRGDAVEEVRLEIYEPPRFFEALLRGRSWLEAPDITARICGICPVAYQMSAVHALERAVGATVDGPLRALRRLLYCGEWIESHALHVFMLHAPDFFGVPDAVALARTEREWVERGLRIRRAGNALLERLGGRAVHPVNVRVGGFYRAPTRAELAELVPELNQAREEAQEAIEWLARLEFPDVERDWELVALVHPDEYAMTEGRLRSTAGLDVEVDAFEEHLLEEQVPHSTALHARIAGRGPYLTGPLARFALSHERLRPAAQEAARRAGLVGPTRNPFRSILVRQVEVVQALDEALALIASYAPPPRPHLELAPRAGVGRAATEAPRGTLLHRYALDAAGLIESARIVPPTSQNQPSIEADVAQVVAAHLDRLEGDALTWRCEQAVRNHDPCISCATHFLRLHLERAP
ncbi:MAG: nickel-dependent hydrogenase large subunit [Planctomycetota bacterium]